MGNNYRVLLVDEKNLTADGFFTEIAGANKSIYKKIKERVSIVLKCLLYAEIRSDIEYQYLTYKTGENVSEVDDKKIDIEKHYKRVCDEKCISREFLENLVKIKISELHGNDSERIISKGILDSMECADVIDEMYSKEYDIAQSLKNQEGYKKLMLSTKVNAEKLRMLIDMFNVSLGLHENYIAEEHKKMVLPRIDNFYKKIERCYSKQNGYDYNSIMEAVAELDFYSKYLDVKRVRMPKQLYSNIDVKKYIESIKLDITTLMESWSAEQIVYDEIKDFMQEGALRWNAFMESALSIIKKIKQEYGEFITQKDKDDIADFISQMNKVKLAYNQYELFGTGEVYNRLEEIADTFDEIDFTTIIDLNKRLLTKKIQKNKNDSEIEIKGSYEKVKYARYKKAYKLVWAEVFSEIRNELHNRNSILSKDLEKEYTGKVWNGAQLEKTLADFNNLDSKYNINLPNRFYRSTQNPNIVLMTYDFLGSDNEKYQRGAVVLDYQNYSKVENQSRRNTWNGKADRSKVNGKQFYQGRYLFANKDTVVFMCNLFCDELPTKLNMSELKEIADGFSRKKDLFDYREENIDKDKRETYSKKYGKGGYITADSEVMIVEDKWGIEEDLNEDAGYLYIDNPQILSDYLLQ